MIRSLASNHRQRFLLFSLVGVANTIVDFTIYSLAYIIGVPAALANIIAFAGTNPFSYFANSRVTFRRDGKPAPLSWSGYRQFLAAHLVSLFISTLIVHFGQSALGPFWVKLAAIFVTVFINYGVSALLVFNRDSDTA